MILVFIILGIIIFITFTMFVFALSNTKLEIKKLHISNAQEKLKIDFVLNIGIYFLNKIKIINFTIDNYKASNLLKSGKIDIAKFKQNNSINKDIIKSLEFRDFTIEYLKLEGCFGLFNTVLSAFTYGIINAIIPILIAKKLEGTYINNIEFLNINENKININVNCIISIKMVNIINILHYLKKKGGNNNGESSYRRSYAYSNE